MMTEHDSTASRDASGISQFGLHEPLRRPFGHGTRWISEAWSLFTRNWGLWIAGLLVLWLITFMVGLVPVLGGLAQVILGPLLYAGVYEVARKGDYDQPLAFEDFFAGFRRRSDALVRLGLLNLGVMLVILLLSGLVAWALLGGSEASAMMSMWMEMEPGAEPSWGAMTDETGLALAIAMLVFLGLMLLYIAAVWFATPLMFFGEEIRPLQAYGLSLRACLKNILPMLLYSLVVMVLMFAVGLTFGLALIIILPLLMISAYTSFHDIFVAPERSRFA